MKYENSNGQTVLLDLIRKISRIIRCEMVRLSQSCGFTAPQVAVLRFVGENGPVTLSHISKEIGLGNSTTSGIVDRLVKHGMLNRARSDSDRREVYISTTEEARKFRDKIFSYKEQLFENLTSRMSEEDKLQLIASLNKVYSILSEMSDGVSINNHK